MRVVAWPQLHFTLGGEREDKIHPASTSRSRPAARDPRPHGLYKLPGRRRRDLQRRPRQIIADIHVRNAVNTMRMLLPPRRKLSFTHPINGRERIEFTQPLTPELLNFLYTALNIRALRHAVHSLRGTQAARRRSKASTLDIRW